MTTHDLELVLAWRNHEDIRRYMYSKHKISLTEHTTWFERVSQDPTRHLLVYESNAIPLGFINFHQIALGGIANWGFYTAPAAPKGTGGGLGHTALKYAFTDAGLHKVCGQALVYNERSIKFHQRLGFQREGVQREQHFDGRDYHNVVCFGLLASEWKASI